MEQLGPVLAQGVHQPPPLPGTVQYSLVQYSESKHLSFQTNYLLSCLLVIMTVTALCPVSMLLAVISIASGQCNSRTFHACKASMKWQLYRFIYFILLFLFIIIIQILTIPILHMCHYS